MRGILSVLSVLLVVSFFVDDAFGDYCFGNRSTCGAGGPGKEITVNDMQHFCLFLPPVAGETVSDSEGCCDGGNGCTRPAQNCAPVSTDAVTSCTYSGYTNGARQFPADLFQSAHLVRDTANKKIQITGKLTPGVWLKPGDDGGQYDFTGTNQYQVNSPPGGKPVGGYIEYMSLVGSDEFCIQLCNTHYGCNSDNDYTGCRVAIPGDYDSPGFTEAEGTIYRQNSPPPGKPETEPSTLVGPPKITAGPSAVASPGAASTTKGSPKKYLDVYAN